MRSLISIDFPAPEMEPESAHVVSAVSVPWLQCGDLPCSTTEAIFTNPSPLRATLSVLCFNSLTNVIDTISNDGGVRKPSMRHLATYFPKQIPTPSRFKFILLINTGLTEKIIVHVLSELKTSVGV